MRDGTHFPTKMQTPAPSQAESLRYGLRPPEMVKVSKQANANDLAVDPVASSSVLRLIHDVAVGGPCRGGGASPGCLAEANCLKVEWKAASDLTRRSDFLGFESSADSGEAGGAECQSLRVVGLEGLVFAAKGGQL